ncbi:hypothetical protein M378DRAFT_734548 [Amanita muscaria Koide BX008]|uniref:NACHT domain-containing protein n=1 Tax=Amanita muscaria (strain Koide BX008) TaxID=946122 RepID=A0A0C2X1D1_AMAMK|nr:hypothetical protein M378DRAFT_734548 [Amanita muscaria Koide BX008]
MFHVKTQSIITLPRAEAVFNDYQNKKKSGPCFKGTREALLREMADWATGLSESRIYLLSGLAGIGKSTVAYTIAARTADLGLLGASFFFSRDEADRKHAKKFFTTIAYQLCVYNETFAKAIGDVLLTERGSAAITKDPQEQLQILILDPLRSIVQSRTRPILVVVDGLDECDEDDEHDVVMGLNQLVQLLPSFKVILTTRPQPLVDYLFHNHDGHKIFHLQDIEDKIVDGDIRLYFSHSLSQEQVRARLRNPKEQWSASDEEIESLVSAAGRLFIIASTAILYVLNKTLGDPGARMKKLLGEIAQDRTPFNTLNHFYSIIVRSAIQVDDGDDDILDRYQIVVGTIVVIQTPLSVATLACFIDEEPENIYALLRNLQSVILLDSDDAPRIYHKSFSDYLTIPARCKDPHLRIDPRIRHTQIATRCFEIMDKNLKYNILDLGDPARFMSNEDGLRKDEITGEQLQEKISPHLRYACVYWASHFEVANIEDADLVKGLAKFVDEQMLHWFEVLSLIGKLALAHRAIRVVLKLLSKSSDLHQLLSDALRFISKHYELIRRSALHVYYSALPFAPIDSLLYRRYIQEAVHGVCEIEGAPEKWDSLIARTSHDGPIEFIKFSLDSALFVSYSEEYKSKHKHIPATLKIWDAATGTPTSTIPGHKFAIANDFSTIVSSESNAIMLYNVNGSARGAILTTVLDIEELAFSSESSRVAAVLSDGTVWLWDSRNAEMINNFYGFEDRARLQFSPTGTRLAYWSMNGIIKLRDGISGRFVADLPVDPWNDLFFVFSSDGSRIASLSYDCDLSLWNSESGGLIGAVKVVHVGVHDRHLTKLAISANGSLLAVSERTQVKLWTENKRGPLLLVVVLNECSRSIAFSLDNILAITNDDGIIKLYHVETQSFISTLQCSSLRDVRMAFSPDRTRFAVGTESSTICLWDIRSIEALESSPPSYEQATLGSVTALAFLRNCSRLAFGFMDGTVELWETSPTHRQIATHRAHTDEVGALGFGPGDGPFASGSDDGTVKLWNGGDGALRGTFNTPGPLQAVAVSNSMVAAAWGRSVAFWTLDTLSCIHTFAVEAHTQSLSMSNDSDLAAIVFDGRSVDLFDIVTRTTIATFSFPRWIRTTTFLPDNSQLVVQCNNGDLYSANLISKQNVKGSILEHLIQLPNIPLWCGVPIWHCGDDQEQHHLAALFSQHESPVPVLWISKDFYVMRSCQGLSMIALHCRDGPVLLLRLRTSQVPAMSGHRITPAYLEESR